MCSEDLSMLRTYAFVSRNCTVFYHSLWFCKMAWGKEDLEPGILQIQHLPPRAQLSSPKDLLQQNIWGNLMLADTWTTITMLFCILSFLKTLLYILKLLFRGVSHSAFFLLYKAPCRKCTFDWLRPDHTSRRACFDSSRPNSSSCLLHTGVLHEITTSWSTQVILWLNKTLGKSKFEQWLQLVKNTNTF